MKKNVIKIVNKTPEYQKRQELKEKFNLPNIAIFSYIEATWVLTEKFDEKDTVFFHNSCTFSRSKFRELYPKTKIVVKLEKATAIIIDKDIVLNNIRNCRDYSYTYFRTDSTDEVYVRVEELEDKSKKALRRDFIQLDNSRWNLQKKDIDFINFFIENNVKLVDVDSIELKSDLVLDEDAFNMINSLLHSGIPANIQLGLTMLPAYDYKKSRQRIAMLLRMNIEAFSGCKDKKTFIDLKTTLDRLKKEFEGILNYNYRTGIDLKDTIQFWVDVYSRFSEDTLVENGINKWFEQEFELDKSKVKIILQKNE